jgi:hypothetical protein
MTGLHIAQSSTIKLALNPTFIQLDTALMYSAPPSAQVWINGLKDSDIIPTERRVDFITQVFWNIHEIITVNTRLRDALNKQQSRTLSWSTSGTSFWILCRISHPL